MVILPLTLCLLLIINSKYFYNQLFMVVFGGMLRGGILSLGGLRFGLNGSYRLLQLGTAFERWVPWNELGTGKGAAGWLRSSLVAIQIFVGK
jgi:hypothetical protein